MLTCDGNKGMIGQVEMILKLLFEQHVKCEKELTWMHAELDWNGSTKPNKTPNSSRLKIFKIVDFVQYCGRLRELDMSCQSI